VNWNRVKSLPRKQSGGYLNEASTDVDAHKISRRGKGIRLVATALSTATAGAGSFYYPVTTDIDRGPHSLAKWLGEKGTARIKGCLRDILVNTRPHGRYSE